MPPPPPPEIWLNQKPYLRGIIVESDVHVHVPCSTVTHQVQESCTSLNLEFDHFQMTPKIRLLNQFLKKKDLKNNSKIVSKLLPTIVSSLLPSMPPTFLRFSRRFSILLECRLVRSSAYLPPSLLTSKLLIAPYLSSQLSIRALGNLGN